MDKYIKTDLISNYGKQFGETVNLFVEEDDELEVGILVNFYELKDSTVNVMIQAKAIGFKNKVTQKSFKFQQDFVAQKIENLDGLTKNEFYNKNCHNDIFLHSLLELLIKVMETYKTVYEDYKQQVKAK